MGISVKSVPYSSMNFETSAECLSVWGWANGYRTRMFHFRSRVWSGDYLCGKHVQWYISSIGWQHLFSPSIFFGILISGPPGIPYTSTCILSQPDHANESWLFTWRGCTETRPKSSPQVGTETDYTHSTHTSTQHQIVNIQRLPYESIHTSVRVQEFTSEVRVAFGILLACEQTSMYVYYGENRTDTIFVRDAILWK